MNYRHGRDFISEVAGKTARRIASMISRRWLKLDESTGDRVKALGREALDGTHEEDMMDAFGPVGLIARPADDAQVEAAVSFVGADGSHPVALAFLDSTRRAVLAKVKLEPGETLIYGPIAIGKWLADGTVEIRSLEGTAKALAFKEDVERLRDELVAHVHVSGGPGVTTSAAVRPPEFPTPIGASPNPITIAGTIVLRAE